MWRAVVPVVAATLVVGACKAERLGAREAATLAERAVAAVEEPAVPAGGEVLEALDRWLGCAADAADADLVVVAEAEDALRGALVVAHEGTGSRRAARAADDPATVGCARRATGDDGFTAVGGETPGDADVAARATATVAGATVELVLVAADEFVVLAGGHRAPDVTAAVEVVEEG